MITIIKLYKKFISPFLGQLFGASFGCRFYPTCSEYAQQAIREWGIVKGGAKSLARITRCNPFFKGGIDIINSH